MISENNVRIYTDPPSRPRGRLNFRRATCASGEAELKHGGLQGADPVFLRHPPFGAPPAENTVSYELNPVLAPLVFTGCETAPTTNSETRRMDFAVQRQRPHRLEIKRSPLLLHRHQRRTQSQRRSRAPLPRRRRKLLVHEPRVQPHRQNYPRSELRHLFSHRLRGQELAEQRL